MRKFTKSLMVLALLFTMFMNASAKTLECNLAGLPESSENTTWNSSTNTFAWSGTSWNSTAIFGSGNYFGYTTLKLNTTAGTADHFRIIIKYTNGTGQTTINPVACGNVDVDLASKGVNLDDMAFIESIRLSGANDCTGNIVVTSIALEGPDVTYIEASEVFKAPAGTTDLNGMTGAGSIKWNVSYPKEMSPGAGWCGNIDGDDNSVDISSYDYLHFVVTSASADANLGLRVFVSEEALDNNDKRHCLYPHPIAEAENVSDWEAFSPITSTGVYVVKISGYPLLRGFKGGNSWQNGNAGTVVVSQAYVSNGTPVDYESTGKYVLAGEAIGAGSLTAALADATATCYDVTGVTGTGVDLTDAANPNALFIAKSASTLTNTKNVIVEGVCENLELTDQKPFKAPADFTATAASFTKTVTDADYATLVLPFNAALPTGVEAYNATSVTNSVINTTAAESIVANKPVLLKNEGTYEFTAENVEVAAVEGVQTNGLLNGVYATTDVPTENGYVLQNQEGNVMFFKAIDGTTVKAFRAYLAVDNADARLGFDFETTGIKKVENAAANNGEFFNLAGQRVAQPTKGLYIMNGKKFIK